MRNNKRREAKEQVMASEDCADIEEGFKVLAQGIFSKSKGKRVYRSKHRRNEMLLLTDKTASSRDGPRDKEVRAPVRETSKALCDRILRMTSANALRGEEYHKEDLQDQAKTQVVLKYLDVSSGMRLAYAEWGYSDNVLILLHGIGESCKVWKLIAQRLAKHGYRVFAVDLRGHGCSTWSSEKKYSAVDMSSDLKDFILHLDLYMQPLAVVGMNIGAAVAMEFASSSPALVGLLGLIDYADELMESSSYSKVQGLSRRVTVNETMKLLTSPMLKRQRRSAKAARAALETMFTRDEYGTYAITMDPDFKCDYGKASQSKALSAVQCPSILLNYKDVLTDHAGRGELEILPKKDSNMHVRYTFERSQGHALHDSGFETYRELKCFFAAHSGAFVIRDKVARTPEALNLRPLPTFNSIEEAYKNLGPRTIPDRNAIEAELSKLREESGYISSDDDSNNALTALTHNPSDYFGMVG